MEHEVPGSNQLVLSINTFHRVHLHNTTNLMDKIHCLTVVERTRISAPPGTIGHCSLPLTFFDISWLLFPPVHHLFLYHFPLSKSHFMEIVVPKLKHSLSITLQHYFPFVGNLVVFPNPHDSTRKPEIRHVEGDSVALTFAETTLDFNDMAGNHPRKSENFHQLVPQLGSTIKGSDYAMIPVFSVQVTCFPNSGISIGITNHHSLGDASTRFGFLKAWASVSESGGDHSFLTNGSPPIYYRLLEAPKAYESRLKLTRLESFYETPSLVSLSDTVRASFMLARTHINGLKKQVLTQVPDLEYVSSFTVACGYIWSCIVKSFVKMGEEKGEDELEQFMLLVNCRSRVDPPLPESYFGNCGASCIVTIKNGVLTGENGFVSAAKLIGEGISRMVNNKEGILKDAERWHDDFKIPARKIGVSGTPKLNFYDIDFGWGKPIKYEVVSLYFIGTVSISAPKGSTAEGFEIGVGFPRMQMEAFANIFNDGLESAIAP